ncbi:hypothetical protein Rsub_02371 [Raphidocelis subcapitata]|uniref:Uncharacterized protein n=1 Tax=Raphidocelis subcapitata TaxID=307507 RepID=A0A2V0NVS2_9CHLO|nr:hypothetical protein Rsub_02371 [Raphidocelis subcapitata]|eukprot:GBF89653.1 hypothetical protein Rsub_02371 [Raphidocelis subcapitata]
MRTKQTPVPARGLSDDESDSEEIEAWAARQGAPHGPQPQAAALVDSGGAGGRARGAAPQQPEPGAAVQEMGAGDGGEAAAEAAGAVEVEGEVEARADAVAAGGVGIVWELDQDFVVQGSSKPRVLVPMVMMRACFPGADLPLEVRLRLEVDGHPWGVPFASRIPASCYIVAGLASFPELFGCRMIGLRRDTDSGGVPALTALLSSVEGVRVRKPDEWPVWLRVTEGVCSKRVLSAKKDMVRAWWPDAQLPLDLTASFALDGAAAGQPVPVQLRRSGRNHVLALRGPIPLPLGSTITSIRRLSPSSIELCASTAATPGGGGAGVRAARARPRPAGVGVKRRRPQRECEDSGSEEEACSSGGSSSSSSGEEEEEEEEEEGGSEEGADTDTEDTAVPMPSSRASGQRPTAAQPPAPDLQRAQRRVGPAPGGQPQRRPLQPQQPQLQPLQQQPRQQQQRQQQGQRQRQQQQQQQPVGARLHALALRRIDPPPGGDALAEAGCTAMLEAQRAAEALRLEPALFAAVCRSMQQAVGSSGGARLFLAGDYPSLHYACSAGDAGVAREWMEHMAARGGGGGGGGGGGHGGGGGGGGA